MLVLRPAPQPIERVVYVPVKQEALPVQSAVSPPVAPAAGQESNADAPTAAERARFSAFQLQREVLRWGIDGLPVAMMPRGNADQDRGPPSLPVVPSYYQLKVALETGGKL